MINAAAGTERLPGKFASIATTRDERVVWEVLRDQLPESAVRFHKLRQQDGPKKREINLLMAYAAKSIQRGKCRLFAIPCSVS